LKQEPIRAIIDAFASAVAARATAKA
jgi:hypothetical protein